MITSSRYKEQKMLTTGDNHDKVIAYLNRFCEIMNYNPNSWTFTVKKLAPCYYQLYITNSSRELISWSVIKNVVEDYEVKQL
jgi:hypothetical protein